MAGINLSNLTEADIITKRILPAVLKAGWDDMVQIRQEVKLRDGKVIVRGKVAARKTVKSADIVLYHKPGIPLAVIEAKANKHEIGKGMQQALGYAQLLDVPFVFASNGDGFIFHDKTASDQIEREINLEDFPSPAELWQKLCAWKGYTEEQLPVITQDYYDDGSGKSPRYYQLQAINKTVEAVSAGSNRILLVMATGTGKTYTAFQIIWRLWKAKNKKRILFLADRNILVDQTKNNDFQPFGNAMTKITGRTVDPAYEIHLALYQAITGNEEHQKAYKQVAPDFFDLIVIAAGNAFYILIVIIGASALRQFTVLFSAIELLGALYLLWIGWHLLRSRAQALSVNETRQPCPSLRKQFLLGLGSALLNPKNALFYLALMAALLGPDVTLLQQSVSGVWMVMVVLVWDLAVVSLIGQPAVQQRLSQSVWWIERVAGAVLMVFGVSILWSMLRNLLRI